MYEVEKSIEIGAPAARVWEVLTRFAEYDEWNPTITRMKAALAPGTPVSFVINVKGRDLPIRGRMLRVEPGAELCWVGPGSRVLGAVFRGEHYLRVEPLGEGRSRLVHGERFGGVVLPALWSRLEPVILVAYDNMNRAVKARAEATPRTSG